MTGLTPFELIGLGACAVAVYLLVELIDELVHRLRRVVGLCQCPYCDTWVERDRPVCPYCGIRVQLKGRASSSRVTLIDSLRGQNA